MAEERLQKILAQAGVASRRAAERYIEDGRVWVNGKVVRVLGSRADIKRDRIEVEGFGVLRREKPVYIMLHKPLHVVSTAFDPEGRRNVVDLVQHTSPYGPSYADGVSLPRIFPVGRLDFDAEGLLLLTNDGDLTHTLLHPRRHVPKTYMVRVRNHPTRAALDRLRAGVRLLDENGRPRGVATQPCEVRIAKLGRTNAWLELTVFEGRYHQVKRMMEAIDHTVVRLIRTDFAGLSVDELPAERWRYLTPNEVAMLKRWGKVAEGSGHVAEEMQHRI